MLIKGFTHYHFKGRRVQETQSGLYDITYNSFLWKSLEIGVFFSVYNVPKMSSGVFQKLLKKLRGVGSVTGKYLAV